MKCPTCEEALTQTGRFWVCPEHGVVDAASQESAAATIASPHSVFISYGREDGLAFADRLGTDLKERGGHAVFIDRDRIEKGGLWEVRIEQGIRGSTVFAAVMTPHSLRETSVCRDEVVFALNEGKNVIPIKADPNRTLKPSLLLARRNWIDFSVDYESGCQALLRYLSGDLSALRPPALPTITGVAPLDFGPEIARFTANFTGREWFNPEIDRWLSGGNRRAMVIVAEPGVGKSALAAWLTQVRDDVIGIHFCTQQNSRTRDPHEFVANLVGQLHARLPGFAEAVEAKHPEVRRPEAADAFRELIVEVARALPIPDRPRLIIVDSLDESIVQKGETILEVLVQHASDLPSWLRVIATTRPEEPILHRIRTLNVVELMAERPENRADVALYIQHRLAMPLLQGRLGGESVVNTAAQLSTLSDGNFLYARMALDAIEDGAIGVTELNRLSPGLAAFFFETFRKRFHDLDVYERSFGPLLRALAAARGPLPFDVLRGLSGETEEVVRRRLHELRSYLRVYGQGEAATYAVYHRSLKDWLSNPEAAGAYWCRAATGEKALADQGWQLNANGSLAGHEYFSRYLPDHLIGAREWSRLALLLSDLNVFERVWAEDRKYEWMRHWQELRGKYEPAGCYEAELDKLIQASTAPQRIAGLSEIVGWFLRLMNLLSAAEPFTERALKLREDIFGKDHPEVALSIHSLAELYRAQQKFSGARALYQRALSIREKRFGAESAEVAAILHDLAECDHDQGNHEFALEHYRHSLSIRQATLKPDDPAIADCLNDMAALQFETGRPDEALPDYQSALRIYEAAYGPDHPDVAASLHNIAQIYKLKENYEGAVALCLRAFNILDRTFGPNHPKTQICTRTLIGLFDGAGRPADSRPFRRRLLEAVEQTLGPDHPGVEAGVIDLATCYKGIGDFGNAAACYRRLLAAKERECGSDSAALADNLDVLVWQFVGVHALADAVACARRSVAIRESAAGSDHLDTANSLNTLLRCLQEQGDHLAALPLCRRALAIRELRCEPGDPDVGTSLNNLGLTLVCLGELSEAEKQLSRAVSINSNAPHPNYWLARLYQQRNQPGDSELELSAWRRYLELGPTSEDRHGEATKRLTELTTQ